MKIDGHSHACGKFLQAEGIVSALEENSLDRVVLVPGERNSRSEYALPSLATWFPDKNVVKITNYLTKLVVQITGKTKDIPSGNEYVYELTKATGGKVLQFVWIIQGIGNPATYLDQKLALWHFQGVKLHQCWERFSIDSAFFRETALWAEKNNLPLFIHLLSDKEVTMLINYKRKHPMLKLIIAHLFGLELFIAENFDDGNIYFDSSTLQLISDKRLMKAIRFYGADKILFGTDTPYGAKDNIRRNIDRIKRLDISKEDKEKIMGLNMMKLLNL